MSERTSLCICEDFIKIAYFIVIFLQDYYRVVFLSELMVLLCFVIFMHINI